MYLDRAGLFNSEYRKIERLIMIMVNAVSLEGPCNDFATFTEYCSEWILEVHYGRKACGNPPQTLRIRARRALISDRWAIVRGILCTTWPRWKKRTFGGHMTTWPCPVGVMWTWSVGSRPPRDQTANSAPMVVAWSRDLVAWGHVITQRRLNL